MLRTSIAFLFSLTLLAAPASALSFSNIFVFGDSIVDTGNVQDGNGGPGAPGDPTPSGAGYFDGRFTNGINPADSLSLANGDGNSLNSLQGGPNFAFGGARARDNGPADTIPDLEAQVSQFNGAVSGVADPFALYVINAGGNDVFDILFGADAATTINAAATAVQQSVLTLQGIGALNFLFIGVGDVGSPPAANGFEGPGRSASEQMNAGIQAALPAGVDFYDTIALFDDVLANPTTYGLPAGIITETSCLNGGDPDPGGAPTCNDYAFFDDVHPTTQVLQILGGELVSFVPEPSTALLLGLGLVGLSARRRAA